MQCLSPQAGVAVALADIDDVLHGVGGEDEQRFLAPADAEPLALADGVEVRPAMLADFLAVADGVAPRGGQCRKLFGRGGTSAACCPPGAGIACPASGVPAGIRALGPYFGHVGSISWTLPLFEASFCCRKAGRSTLPTKQMPCESLRLAVANPCSAAMRRTSGLSRSPTGNRA